MVVDDDIFAALFAALPAAITVYEFPTDDPLDGFLLAFNEAATIHTGMDLAPFVKMSAKHAVTNGFADLVTDQIRATFVQSYAVATGASKMQLGTETIADGAGAGEYESALFSVGNRRCATLFRRIDNETAAANALSWAVESLAAANQTLDRFASTVAHDLKNPLAGIIGNAELVTMTARDLGPDASTALTAIADLARLSSTMIDGLLAYNRAPTDTRHDSIDVAGAVAWAVKVLDHQIAANNATVVVQGWARAEGNEAALRQVVLNLISNSLSYRSPGRDADIRVRIAGEADTADGSVVISVVDNGAGVEPNEREAIFGWGNRGDASHARAGSGIGLAACRSIVTALGGSISVVDHDDVGTRIDITLKPAG